MQLHRRAGAAEQRLRLRLPLCRALTPKLVARVAKTGRKRREGWPSWAFENHDAPRAISRWVSEEHRDAFARTKMLLLCALRGSIILYQGEELGLPQVDVPFDRLQDPEAIANWPQTLSRDGARTPMPWSSTAPNLGFSTGEPWLPLGETTARSPSTCSKAFGLGAGSSRGDA
jgi:alpha-glucosidase